MLSWKMLIMLFARSGKCTSVFLKFPFETSQELRSRDFIVHNDEYHVTKLCFKE